MTTSTSEQKLFNVTELLRLPKFPDFDFGTGGPDSLRLLNEDLLYAQSTDEIESALDGLEEARDRIDHLIEASQDRAHVYCLLCAEVWELGAADQENLTAKEINNLILDYSEKLWVLGVQRSLRSICRDCFDSGKFLSASWAKIEDARREVMSWFGIKISQDEVLLNQSELIQRHLLQATE